MLGSHINSRKNYLEPQARNGSAARDFAQITAIIAVRNVLAAHLPATRLRTRGNRTDQDC